MLFPNKKFLAIVFTFVVSIALFSCEESTKPIPQLPKIKFKVVDAKTNIPLENVVVKLGEKIQLWGLTDSKGEVTFTGLQSQTYNAQFSSNLYFDLSEEVIFTNMDYEKTIKMTHFNSNIDVTPPKIMSVKRDEVNIYFLFSEPMDAASVKSAIKNAVWERLSDPCNPYNLDKYLSTKFNFIFEKNIILSINHPLTYTTNCNLPELHSETVYYTLKSFILENSAKDLNNNTLVNGWEY